jgi:hypothetical protein
MPHQTERQLAADGIQHRFFAGIIAELTAQLDDLLCYLITHATGTVLFLSVVEVAWGSKSSFISESAAVGLVRDFGGRRLFLALAIADSFALARRACNDSFAAMGVSDARRLPVARMTSNFTFRCCAVHAGRKQRHWKTTRFPNAIVNVTIFILRVTWMSGSADCDINLFVCST